MGIIFSYIKDKVKIIVMLSVATIVFSMVFFLYNLPLEPVLYGTIICLCIGGIYGIIDILNYKKKDTSLKNLKKSIIYSIDNLPNPRGIIEEDYSELINILFKEKGRIFEKRESDLRDMTDYYTMWAHQIKTPIAAMKISLQRGEGENNLELLNELFKIEQYVEMVIGYLRMESMSRDLVLKEYFLDHIVRQVIRKYAKLFIGKRISLKFEELNTMVLTDEKWLVFVVEQIISNAIKYTGEDGKVSIYMDKDMEKTLVIEDSGIGIEVEDLPRVFEKGFTGFNGRIDKKATGIGLYLCKTILKKLSHKIEIESEVGEYTRVKIKLETLNLTKV